MITWLDGRGVCHGVRAGFLPWVLYRALIGNVSFRLAAVLVLVVAIAVQVLGRLRRQPWRSLEVGSLAVFAPPAPTAPRPSPAT
jgi:hypothetical protein